MNKKVYIKQDGTIPGNRIIEELERRGGSNRYSSFNGDNTYSHYYIENNYIKMSFASPLKGYIELLYNKETDSFYEKEGWQKHKDEMRKSLKDSLAKETEDSWNQFLNEKDSNSSNTGKNLQRMVSAEAKEALLTDLAEGMESFTSGWILRKTDKGFDYLYDIPEGYEAKVEDGKVIVKKKKWQPNEDDIVFTLNIDYPMTFVAAPLCYYTNNHKTLYNSGLIFKTKEECQAFCDKLNAAIKPILEERRKEIEK